MFGQHKVVESILGLFCAAEHHLQALAVAEECHHGIAIVGQVREPIAELARGALESRFVFSVEIERELSLVAGECDADDRPGAVELSQYVLDLAVAGDGLGCHAGADSVGNGQLLGIQESVQDGCC